jgi:hypothetical protein
MSSRRHNKLGYEEESGGFSKSKHFHNRTVPTRWIGGLRRIEMDTILANHWGDRRPQGYDVVVVGSGYGGAITAARLSNANLNARLPVFLLERGQEWPVGNFPDSLPELVANTYNSAVNRLGLYEFDAFRDIAVIKGSGLGGTSLVNANVAIRPEPDVFDVWPSALRQAAQIGETRTRPSTSCVTLFLLVSL